MSTEPATTLPGSALALPAEQDRVTPQQLAGLKQLGIEDAPEGDLAVFFHVAQRTGLDPFARQIHMIGRKSKTWDPATRQERWETKYTIQTGIDGYRVTASRAARRDGDQLGYEDTQWCGPDGLWVDAWTNPHVPPTAARVVLVKNDRRYPGVALYAEYVQTYKDKQGNLAPNSMWAKMPAGQLAKCAEALAIRRAYPLDFAGLYADEEMGQADNPAPARQPSALAAARARSRPLQFDSELGIELFALMDQAGIVNDRLDFVADTVGRPIRTGADVTVADAEAAIKALRDLQTTEDPTDKEEDES